MFLPVFLLEIIIFLFFIFPLFYNSLIIKNVNELTEQIKNIQIRIEKAKKLLKLDKTLESIKDLEARTKSVDFWNDNEAATKTMTEIAELNKEVNTWIDLEKRAEELLGIAEVTHDNKSEISKELQSGIEDLRIELDRAEFVMLFSGQYDKYNAILSVYAGSGGTDAQDWAEMLMNMYLKFATLHGFKVEIINISKGEEAGIKSVTIGISGSYAFGYLKSEKGVHRLVRISPFDSDKARHTSFALVDVIPEIENIDSKINEKDLKIEVYRASGHGGQSVNTTDSAVRITHVPSGLIVTCQKERSQLQNKNYALKILASKLKILEEEKTREKISEIRGENISAEWGNQIRSYVIHPYNKVKDHRTDYETSDTEGVFAGKIDEFIESYLKALI